MQLTLTPMKWIVWLVLLMVVLPSSAIEQSLLDDIKQAKQQLVDTEQRILNARKVIIKDIEQLSTELIALRRQAAITQRLKDEQTLGLSQLESRHAMWQEQAQYQTHMLNSVLREKKQAPQDNLISAISSYEKIIQRLVEKPHWKEGQIIDLDGKLGHAQVQSLGPIAVFRTAQSAGLVEQDEVTPKVIYSFSSDVTLGWLSNNTEDQLALSFDPTLSKGVMVANQKESFLAHLQNGGVWVVPILLFAFVAVGIALLKAWQLFKLPKVPNSTELVGQLHLSRDAGIHSGVNEFVDIWQKEEVGARRDDAFYSLLSQKREYIERYLGAIAITAAVAPLLGLLGTVSGMIDTFKMMTIFGSGDPQVVSGGISQALITTEFGLIVAIPALIAHALLSRKAKTYYHGLEDVALNLSQLPNHSFQPASEAA
ncbi:MotA/TolQ/ExbB proton channel family protein [Pseudoalteromonas luteoviolacea B = ATCC 29581]|nr:MotA/TolQ/ExbB proton channel family protein [Pseudoalteromonas luteoviolacea B = ATCC 29581]